jgi:hypothetical protein
MSSEYPRWMYAKDGRAQIVQHEDEEAALGPEFSREPSDVHRQSRGVPDMPLPHGQEALFVDLANRLADAVVERLRPLLSAPSSTEPVTRERKRA